MFLGTSEPCDDPVHTKNVLARFLPRLHLCPSRPLRSGDLLSRSRRECWRQHTQTEVEPWCTRSESSP